MDIFDIDSSQSFLDPTKSVFDLGNYKASCISIIIKTSNLGFKGYGQVGWMAYSNMDHTRGLCWSEVDTLYLFLTYQLHPWYQCVSRASEFSS